MSILDWGPLSRIRRNHALEHATLRVLEKRNPTYRMAGYSDTAGFWMLGNVPSEEVRSAAEEALLRMQDGEHSLAVHPNCGTNYAASGIVAGSLAWLAMLGADKDWKKNLDRWPLLITLITVALILTQPLGPFLQAYVTTDGHPRGMRIHSVQRQLRGEMPVHRVLTTG